MEEADFWMHSPDTCYYGMKRKTSLMDAENFCKKNGANILKVDTLEKQKFITNELRQSLMLNMIDWSRINIWMPANVKTGRVRWNHNNKIISEDLFESVYVEDVYFREIISGVIWNIGSDDNGKEMLGYTLSETNGTVICERSPAFLTIQSPVFHGHYFLFILVIIAIAIVGFMYIKKNREEQFRYLIQQNYERNNLFSERLRF